MIYALNSIFYYAYAFPVVPKSGNLDDFEV